jgi:hypothetical protein
LKLQLFTRTDVHFPYQFAIARYLGLPYLNTSFVTHFQLMLPDLVKEVFPTPLDDSLRNWLDSAPYKWLESSISEYQTLAQYAYFKHTATVSLNKLRYVDWDINQTEELELSTLRKMSLEYDVLTVANEHLRAVQKKYLPS